MSTANQPLALRPPMFISARLMAAVRVGDTGATIHIEPVRRDSEDRVVWRYLIEDSDHTVIDDAADLRSGTGEGVDARHAMTTLIAFLDAYRGALAGHPGDDGDLFPPEVMEWAYEHEDQLAVVALDLHEAAPAARRIRIIRRYFAPDDITDGDIGYRHHETDDIDCEPDDVDAGDTAITIAANALRDAGCTQPSTTPGPLGPGDWWTHPDGSRIIDHTTALRCEKPPPSPKASVPTSSTRSTTASDAPRGTQPIPPRPGHPTATVPTRPASRP